MKRMVLASTILTWFNLIVSGFLLISVLFSAAALVGLANAIMPIVMLGSIALHSYAALQLRRSLVDPRIPLAANTPTGIRFIGYIALFFAILYGASGIAILQHIPEVLKQVPFPPEYKNVNMAGILRGISIFAILFGTTILLNVLLNFRLLRWYQYIHQNDGAAE